MFDLGWTELLLIGVVALIVVGPKDLPGMFRQLGKFTAKAKSMGREFQRSMEDAAKESGVSELKDDLQKMTSVSNLGLDSVKTLAEDFATDGWDDENPAAKFTSPPKGSKSAKAVTKSATKSGTKAAAKSGTKAKAKPAAKKSAAKKPATKKPATSKISARAPAKKPAKAPAAKKPAQKAAASKTAAAKKAPSRAKPTPKAKS
ncbi:MAG: twin-arginine translocase subunit TatB [Alphaproteobacteria bacterium]|nr:twin-arginine translocase subunit TatB [Alphaproteobacteria bacterium]